MERYNSPAMNPENGPGRLFLERAKCLPLVGIDHLDTDAAARENGVKASERDIADGFLEEITDTNNIQPTV